MLVFWKRPKCLHLKVLKASVKPAFKLKVQLFVGLQQVGLMKRVHGVSRGDLMGVVVTPEKLFLCHTWILHLDH